MALWVIRILFLCLCTIGGYAVSQVRPELVNYSLGLGMVIGFGFGWLMIAIDEMLKGFSLRAFSATTFGLLLGTVVALLIDHSGLFENVPRSTTRWLIRLGLFLGFSYIGIVLAMRSNKEDFSLIIPYVRFAPQNKPDNLLLLDTSVIIDGRIADLIEANFLEGIIVVPRFVLQGTAANRRFQRPHQARPRPARPGNAQSHPAQHAQRGQDSRRRFPGGEGSGRQAGPAGAQPGREALHQRLQPGQDRRAADRSTTSTCTNWPSRCASILLPGEMLNLRIVREGKDKGQGIGYLPDGTMVVVNNAQNIDRPAGRGAGAEPAPNRRRRHRLRRPAKPLPPSPAHDAALAHEPRHRLYRLQSRRRPTGPLPARSRAASTPSSPTNSPR